MTAAVYQLPGAAPDGGKPQLRLVLPKAGGKRTTKAQREARLAKQTAAARALERQERRAALVRHHSAKRRAAQLQRTPSWADMDAILAVYDAAHRLTVATGVQHHVDHEIPLQGELVSGLHVANNLQILTGTENSRKKNRFSIEP